jgi:hypothetical protein
MVTDQILRPLRISLHPAQDLRIHDPLATARVVEAGFDIEDRIEGPSSKGKFSASPSTKLNC